jgi:hypothetical protein
MVKPKTQYSVCTVSVLIVERLDGCQMSSSKRIDMYRDFAAGVLSVCGPPSPPMTPPPYTLYMYVYTVYLFSQGRGESYPEKRLEGLYIVHKAGQKIPT